MKDIMTGLGAKERELLRQFSEPRVVTPGTLLYNAGDPARGFYQVLTGAVDLFTKDTSGDEKFVMTATDGHFFGLSGALPDGPVRWLTAKAKATTSIYEFPVNPADLFEKSVGAAGTCVLLKNMVGALSELILDWVKQHGELPKLSIQLHSSIPLNPNDWLSTIEGALPGGLFTKLFCKCSFAPGEVVLEQGKVADKFYFLKEGTISLKVNANGRTTEVSLMKAPDTVGHLSFFAGLPQPFSVEAKDACTAIPFSRSAFDGFIKDNPKEALQVLNAILRLMIFRMAEVERGR